MLIKQENFSVKYHQIFDYELVKSDFPKWSCRAGSRFARQYDGVSSVKSKKRIQREKISEKKLLIARKASKILSMLSSVKMVAITGSLAMKNSTEDSDIDLMIVASKNTLWMTRLMCLFLLSDRMRRFGVKDEKDKLCLNMWLDEGDLVWKKSDRNVYIAHEIAQIIPLVNKDKAYERFLNLNKWILDFWPHAVKIKNYKFKIKNSKASLIEKFCYKLQLKYMQSKITRETITPTRALFHPHDWGKVVMTRLLK